MKDALAWLKTLNLDKIPVLSTKAMWCGYRSYKDHSNKFPWIVKKLFSDFDAKVYVEIGIAGGGGIVMASEYSSSDTIVVGIDPLEKKPESKTVSHPIFGNKNAHLIRKKSQNAVSDLEKLLDGKKIDILVVDGDHTYKGAISDFRLYIPLVSIGGLIWFDDIAHEPGVKKAWQEIKKGISLPDNITYSYWDWGIGEIEGGKKDSKGRIGIDGVWIERST